MCCMFVVSQYILSQIVGRIFGGESQGLHVYVHKGI